VPYRNTRQIYRAAYEVIREDEVLKRHLEDQLRIDLEPDMSSEYLRSGPRPSLHQFRSLNEELTFIRSEIEYLLQKGFDPRQIIVLHRRKSGVRKLERHIRGLDVEVSTFHAPKGLEYEVAFLSQMQSTFPREIERSEEALSGERRLVYMAMTRARERLYLNYEGHWPGPLEGVRQYVD
jgi:superfamily I DNA/RNA helicase